MKNNKTSFQSLFYWITYSYYKLHYISLHLLLFQSLFYWITYSYFKNWEVSYLKREGFNPYFIGLPILIITVCQNREVRLWFQSLFYWITYSYNEKINFDLVGGIASFNPYFIGLPILMNLLTASMTISTSWFQSLFYWITYSYHDE